MSLLKNAICNLQFGVQKHIEIDMLTPAENSERSADKHMRNPLEEQYTGCIEALPRDNRML
jgi:hypothetical protein